MYVRGREYAVVMLNFVFQVFVEILPRSGHFDIKTMYNGTQLLL